MARFLFAVWPFSGCLFPHIAVARAVAARGHDVAFYTGDQARDVVAGQGFQLFPFAPALERQIEALVWAPAGISSGYRHPWRLEPLLRAFYAGTVPHQVEDLDAVLAEWGPDAIACDPAVWAPIVILHETRRVPVGLLSPYAACLLPGPDAPPAGSALPRPTTWRSRLLAGAARIVVAAGRTRVGRDVDALRRDHGLPPLGRSVLEWMGRFPLFVVPSCPEFDYERRDLPPAVHYVGPCLWYPGQAAGEPTDDQECDATAGPLVHVTEGTLHVREPLVLRAAAEGLANLPMRVVISTGGRVPLALGLRELAPNISLARWVSYAQLLPRVDVVVTTGGSGTVLAALMAGKPMVVVPVMWDQPENAQRVVEASAGVRLAAGRCTPKRLRSAVEQVLSDGTYRQNAERLGAALRRYGGPEQAAGLLERVLTAHL